MSFEAVFFDGQGVVAFATPGARAAKLPEKLKIVGLDRTKRLRAIDIDGVTHIALILPVDNGLLGLVRKEQGAGALVDFISTVEFSYDILEHFLTSPYEGVTVVDAEARLRYISPVHEEFFGMKRGASFGKAVKDVIENTRLDKVVKTGTPEIGQVQEMRGVTRVVNRVPIRREGKLVGAIGQVMFKAPEQVHALSKQISTLRSEVEHYRKELVHLQQKTFGLNEIIGGSAPMLRLKEQIRKVAAFDIPVFISGESGTGKELIAQAIHGLSSRADRSMVVVNCGSLPENLVESELFGYESGAFTGARKEGRVGKFELADCSSLFLDEIGDMPVPTQVKLLRVLENGTFERLGGNRERKTNFRLISATNRDLRRRITDEEFRADLYFRINGITLHVPPLRERLEDIPLLADHCVKRAARRMGADMKAIGADALDVLMNYSWPGNVRQLQNVIQRAVVFSDRDVLRARDFHDLDAGGFAAEGLGMKVGGGQAATIKENIGKVELLLIKEAIQRHAGNKKKVAEELGISRSYLYKRLAEIDG